jgi:hypothetical protein
MLPTCLMEKAHHANDLDTFQPIGLAAERVISNLIKLRKLTKMFGCPNIVGDGGIQGIIECSKSNVFAVHNQSSGVPIPARSVDTLKPGPRQNVPLVCVVLRATRLPQISEGVVIATTVNVIDQIDRPLSGAVEPSQTRSAKEISIDTNNRVALHRANTARALSKRSWFKGHPPSEDAGQRIVSENFLQSVQDNSVVKLMSHCSGSNKQKQNPDQGDEPNAREDKKTIPDSQEDIERRIRDILAMENRLRRKRI